MSSTGPFEQNILLNPNLQAWDMVRCVRAILVYEHVLGIAVLAFKSNFFPQGDTSLTDTRQQKQHQQPADHLSTRGSCSAVLRPQPGPQNKQRKYTPHLCSSRSTEPDGNSSF